LRPLGRSLSSAVILGGLVVSLFVTRRRAWIRVHEADEKGSVRVEFAALARGDDPGLEAELERLVADFSQEHDHKLVTS